MKILFVHGAYATPLSFAYIKDRLPYAEFIDFSYTTRDPIDEAVEALVSLIEQEGPVTIISHSLGGLISIAAAKRVSLVDKIITLSSPLGGSRIAGFLRYVYPRQLFDDIHMNSRFVRSLKKGPLPCPILSVVTTEGAQLLIPEPNDGVVSVSSQKAIEGPRYVEMPLNHFEVLLSRDVVDVISLFIAENISFSAMDDRSILTAAE